MTPIRRIERICGQQADKALDSYGDFLRKLGDHEIREMLKNVKPGPDQPEQFRLLKNDGHHFSWMLSKLLKDTYDLSHPIHNALVV